MVKTNNKMSQFHLTKRGLVLRIVSFAKNSHEAKTN